jgi:hypothetical protein
MALPHSDVDVETAPSDVPPPQRSQLDVRTIAEASLLMDVTVLLVLLRTFLPIPGIQGLVRLACPLPFVLLALRRGPRVGLIATMASYVLLSTFVGPLLATQVLVFGGLGSMFAWASQRRFPMAPTIVVGAALYGLLYLLPPFLFSLLVLRINLIKTLHDVQKNAGSFLKGLGHLQFLGVKISEPLVHALSSSGPGRAILDTLHGVALTLLTHPLATLVGFFAAYSLVNVWAYLIVSIELYRRLPPEARRTAQGGRIDFFPVR